MSKTKNKSNQGKPYRYNDAVLQYQAKNYTGSYNRLRGAQLRPEETQKARHLEYLLLLRIALQHLQNAEYSKTIQVLQNLASTDALASGLSGIAQLYLAQYRLAIPLLQKFVEKQPNFAVYVLLAALYDQKNIDFNTFTTHFQTEWNQCSKQHQQYIEIVHAIFNEKIQQAVVLAENFKTESHFQHLNWDAFKIILNQDAIPDNINEKVKIWYRGLLYGILKDFEKEYLKQFGEITEMVLQPGQKPLSNVLTTELEAQFTKQQILKDASFHALMEGVSVSQRCYIIYNQAANLWNQKDANGLKTLKYLLSKYLDDFARIPESLNLMMMLYTDEHFESNPASFWQFVKKWLPIHKASLSVEQIDALGWNIVTLWMEYPDLATSHHNIDLMRLSRELPTAFGLKLGFFMSPNLQQPVKSIADDRLDLFALPNAEKSKTQFMSVFAKIHQSISPYRKKNFLDMFKDEDDVRLSKPRYIQQITYWAECLILATEKYSVPARNLIALEAFKLVHQAIKQILNDKGTLNHQLYERFIQAYHKTISIFKPDDALSEFQSDVEYAVYRKYLPDLVKLYEKNANVLQYEQFLAKCKDVAHFSFVWEQFAHWIDQTHFEESVAEQLSMAWAAVMGKLKSDLTRIRIEIAHFLKIYKKIIEKADCEHPTTFYAMLIRNVLKYKTLNLDAVYLFVTAYILELTIKYSLESKQYNAVAEFLEWIRVRKYNNNVLCDKLLIQQLRQYLQKVNQQKELKKLEKIIASSANLV